MHKNKDTVKSNVHTKVAKEQLKSTFVHSKNIPGSPDGKKFPAKADVKTERTVVEGTTTKPLSVGGQLDKSSKKSGLVARNTLDSIASYELYLQYMVSASKIDRKRCAKRFVEYAETFISHKRDGNAQHSGSETKSTGESSTPETPTHEGSLSPESAPPINVFASQHTAITDCVVSKSFVRRDETLTRKKLHNIAHNTSELSPLVKKTYKLTLATKTMFCRLPPVSNYVKWLWFFCILCRWKWTSSYPAGFIAVSAIVVIEYFIETVAIFFSTYLLFYALLYLKKYHFSPNPYVNPLPYTVMDILTEVATTGTELVKTNQDYIPISRLRDYHWFHEIVEKFYPGFKPVNLCMLDSLGFTHYRTEAVYLEVLAALMETKSGISPSLPSISSLYNKVSREFKDSDTDVLMSTCCYFVQRNEIAMRKATYCLGNTAKSTPLLVGKAQQFPQCDALGLHHTGIFRVYPSDFSETILYVDNSRFRRKKSKFFKEDGRIDFEESSYEPTSYRTVFFGFYHQFIEYGKSANCTSAACTRLTNRRNPTHPTQNEDLYASQAAFLRGSFDHTLVFLRDIFDCADFDTDIDYKEREYAFASHPKRALRTAAQIDKEQNGLLFDYHLVKKALGSVKTQEWAKINKIPRQVVDLSVSSSLVAGWVISVIKEKLSNFPYRYAGAEATFIKEASLDKLQTVFESALEPSVWLQFWYHSDDSFMSLTWKGITLWLEMDINSCDTSHGPELFDAFLSVMPKGRVYEAVEAVIAQCQLPLNIVCPTNPWKKVTLVPEQPVLYSGSTITTILNCLGCLTIFKSIADHRNLYDQCETVEDVKALTIHLASLAGYIVTVDVWEHIQQATFLKHSSNEHGEPWLNLGVIQRLSGTCKGDLPGSGDINTRCEIVQSKLIEGLVHAGDSAFTDALRARFPKYSLTNKAKKIFDRYSKQTGSYIVDQINSHTPSRTTPVRVTDADIMFRYNLNEIELDALVSSISNFTSGQVIDCSASRKIYTKDYKAVF